MALEPQVSDTQLVLSKEPQLKDGSRVGCHEGAVLGVGRPFSLHLVDYKFVVIFRQLIADFLDFAPTSEPWDMSFKREEKRSLFSQGSSAVLHCRATASVLQSRASKML